MRGGEGGKAYTHIYMCIYIYIIMTDLHCCMAETQTCKAVFHQLKNKNFFKNKISNHCFFNIDYMLKLYCVYIGLYKIYY